MYIRATEESAEKALQALASNTTGKGVQPRQDIRSILQGTSGKQIDKYVGTVGRGEKRKKYGVEGGRY